MKEACWVADGGVAVSPVFGGGGTEDDEEEDGVAWPGGWGTAPGCGAGGDWVDVVAGRVVVGVAVWVLSAALSVGAGMLGVAPACAVA